MATTTKLTDIRQIVEAAGIMRKVYRESSCACGCGGSWNKTVSGTIGGLPALWMGCSRRNGSAVGGGLTGTDYHVARAVIRACDRLGIDVQDAVESTYEDYRTPINERTIFRGQIIDYVTGPLEIDYERQLLIANIKAHSDGYAYATRPTEELIAQRHLAFRGILDDVCDGIYEPLGS